MSALSRGLGLTLAVAGLAQGTAAQQFRVQVDTRVQAVAYRGVQFDSVLATDTVTGPTGGPVTSRGFAASCTPGIAYCTFYRPGPEEHARPLTSTADLTLFGLGVTGLSIRASGQAGTGLGGADPWPGTEPPTRLLEAFAQLARQHYTLQLGRQTVTSRLGFTTFDGGRLTLRDGRHGLEVTGYGGWGVSHGSVLPVTSPALNPLGEYRPPERTLTAGAGAGWSSSYAELRVTYEREVDPSVDYFVSERTGVDAVLRPYRGVSISGGADYDLAEGWWGSAEAALGYVAPSGHVTAAVSVRRYRPHFDLWTIWGAFAPVPYTAYDATLTARPLRHLQLYVTGEHYRFATSDAATPLVTTDTSGWRFSWNATYSLSRWSLQGGYRAEFGPGAASRGFEGAVTYSAGDLVTVGLQGATLDRPLEFRYDESSLDVYGIFAHFRPSPRLRIELDASQYAENRQRPDAAAFDWDQLRVSARVVLMFSSGGESGVPRAVDRMPVGPESRP